MALRIVSEPELPLGEGEGYLCLTRGDTKKWCVKEGNIFFEEMRSSGIQLFRVLLFMLSRNKRLISRSRFWKD